MDRSAIDYANTIAAGHANAAERWEHQAMNLEKQARELRERAALERERRDWAETWAMALLQEESGA